MFNAAGEVLLLRHKRGSWVFPKGHLDPGETRLQAALREVEEEAGVEARALSGSFVPTTHYQNDRGEERLIHWFILTTDASTPVLRETTFPEGVFLEPEKALERLSFEEDRELLRKALTWRTEHGE